MAKASEGGDRSRREFLKGLGAVPALALVGGRGLLSPADGAAGGDGPGRTSEAVPLRTAPVPPPERKLVGIQIGGRSFVDEGVDGCLDTLQQKGGVNALCSTVFTYGTGLAGRQAPPRPLPDHGGQKYLKIHGGCYTAVHPEFYADSPIRPEDLRAPDLGKFDILADVTAKAKARGIETYALFEEVYNPKLIPNFEKISEVDVYGRLGPSTCLNNPGARAFLTSMVSDWMTSNELDGLMWESERQGPLNNMIGAHGGSVRRRMHANCFCHYCTEKARAQGIDVARAKQGYIALDEFMKRTLAGDPETDGTFISFWRLLVEYPEIMAWHRFWFHSQEEAYGLIYGTAKSINPRARVGWHLMYYVTLSPFFMADEKYARLARNADFIKPATYNNCGGPRFAAFIRNVQSTIFRDMPPDEVLEMHYRWLHWTGEATLEKLPTAGLSAHYVAHEYTRAATDVNGEIPIYPGIDIDIPTRPDEKQTRPEDVKATTLAAFRAGAPGVVLSRKYAEMRLANLAGAGAALKELGYV